MEEVSFWLVLVAVPAVDLQEQHLMEEVGGPLLFHRSTILVNPTGSFIIRPNWFAIEGSPCRSTRSCVKRWRSWQCFLKLFAHISRCFPDRFRFIIHRN